MALGGKGVSSKVVAMLANRARNEVKHRGADGPSSVWMDPKEEARDLLDRAVDNYFRVTESQTELMGEFIRRVYG
jgi:hypothetical protein